MKKTTLILMAVLSVAACSNDTVGPAEDISASLYEAADLGFSASFVADGGSKFIADLFGRLPENLKLSAAQHAAVKALVDAFTLATKADHDALVTIQKEAHAAARAGKTKAEVDAILARGTEIRTRLAAAEAKLRADALALLTPEQRAWIESHSPKPCADTLTPQQKTQIAALIATFEQANRADLDATKAAYQAARAAHKNGATREQVAAILAAVKPAMDRLHVAQAALGVSIAALLTPEQLASKCRPSIGRHK